MSKISIDYGLSPQDLETAMDLLPEYYNDDTVGPRAIVMDWQKCFEEDMNNGNGFIVKSKPFKKKTKDRDGNTLTKGVKEMDGIHSPRFGSDWQDENAFADRWSCKCGKLIGHIFEGRKCPDCNTKVKFVDVNLNIFAWMKIENPEFEIIQPLMYRKLDSYFGKGVLASIIDFKMEMKLNGYYEQPDDVDYSKNPFYGIGMVEFRKRFDEIMAYYAKKKKNKALQYERIMADRHKIFVSVIPIYSAVLREVFITNEDYSYTKIDKHYNALYGNICKLNEETVIVNHNVAKINRNMYRAQVNLNTAWELIFTSINEKEGLN